MQFDDQHTSDISVQHAGKRCVTHILRVSKRRKSGTTIDSRNLPAFDGSGVTRPSPLITGILPVITRTGAMWGTCGQLSGVNRHYHRVRRRAAWWRRRQLCSPTVQGRGRDDSALIACTLSTQSRMHTRIVHQGKITSLPSSRRVSRSIAVASQLRAPRLRMDSW